MRIPCEVSANPFYPPGNLRYLDGIMADVQAGRAHFSEHELAEEE